MIIIRYPDENTERRAMEYLVTRCSFKTWATGEMLLPEAAVDELTREYRKGFEVPEKV